MSKRVWNNTCLEGKTPYSNLRELLLSVSSPVYVRIKKLWRPSKVSCCFLLFGQQDHTKEDDQFYSCIIQYVLFPPYLQPSEAGRGEEAIADWTLEGKPALGNTRQKFNMVTEVWAEPQFGVLTDLPSELKYLDGLKYNEVPDAVCW